MCLGRLDNVKLFLFDLDGTIYLGDTLIEGSLATLETLRKSGRRVVFLTNNSSRTKEGTLQKLNNMSIPSQSEDIITSLDACVDLLKSLQKDNVFVLGTRAVKEYLSSYFTLTDGDDAKAVLLTFDTELVYSDLFQFVKLVDRGVFYAAANSDIYCPSSEGKMPDAGSYIKLVESVTKRLPDVICGKPYPYLGDYILKKFNLSAGEVAMVGDRLYTDIEFALDCGFHGVLVYSGETDKAQYDAWDKKSDAVTELQSVADLPNFIRRK